MSMANMTKEMLLNIPMLLQDKEAALQQWQQQNTQLRAQLAELQGRLAHRAAQPAGLHTPYSTGEVQCFSECWCCWARPASLAD